MAAHTPTSVFWRAPALTALAHRQALSWTCLSLLAVFLGCRTASAAPLPNAPDVWASRGPAFAIADFDGDSRPDLADVQVRQSKLGNSVYWIDLQLSTAGRRSIRLVAPPGGLRISAQDVNGDEAVDLVITTAWSNAPVAIYLNDGHGSFTHAAPASFPAAFRQFRTHWSSASHLTPRVLAVLPELRSGICRESGWSSHLPGPRGPLPFPESLTCPVSSLFSYRDRAPPFDFSRL